MALQNYSTSDLLALANDVKVKEDLLAKIYKKEHDLLDLQTTISRQYNTENLGLQVHGRLVLAHLQVLIIINFYGYWVKKHCFTNFTKKMLK